MTIFHVLKYLPTSTVDVNSILAIPDPIYNIWLDCIRAYRGENPATSITQEDSLKLLKKVLEEYNPDDRDNTNNIVA